MVRKVLAGFLLVAGLSVLGYALGDGSVYAQIVNGGTNSCCVWASKVPPEGGTCPNLNGKDFKDTICPSPIVDIGGFQVSTCPLTPSDGNVKGGAFWSDFAIPGQCVRQGFAFCNRAGSASLAIRRGYKLCQGSFVKISGSLTSQTPAADAGQVVCHCVFVLAGAHVENVVNCNGKRCNGPPS